MFIGNESINDFWVSFKLMSSFKQLNYFGDGHTLILINIFYIDLIDS